MADLPTVADILDQVYDELDQSRWHASEAANWMRSDWDSGRRLTDAEAEARAEVYRYVGEVKVAVDRAKGMIDRARGDA